MSATAGLTESDATVGTQAASAPLWEGALPVILLGAALSAILVAGLIFGVVAVVRTLG